MIQTDFNKSPLKILDTGRKSNITLLVNNSIKRRRKHGGFLILTLTRFITGNCYKISFVYKKKGENSPFLFAND